MAVQKKAAGKGKKGDDWDSEENEAQSINFKFGRPTDEEEDYKGDRILGYLVSKRQVPNKLSSEPGAKQWVYETKVIECEYHMTDKKGNPVDESTVIDEGETVNVYGKPFFDGRMRSVKVGQKFGLKYVGDLEAKVAGHNDTKEIKVYTPKGDDGEFEFDPEIANQAEVDDF